MEDSTEALTKRFEDLEASQAHLREQLSLLLREERREPWPRFKNLKGGRGGVGKLRYIPGFFANSLSRSILQHLGHAVYVSRSSTTGEIIYWNKSAENLYGWNDHEALGRRVSDLLVNEEYCHIEKIMQRLRSGQSCSGQFQFRKRSGEIFTAMATHSPLYEDDEFIGVITVSSDAAILCNYKQPEREPNANRAKRILIRPQAEHFREGCGCLSEDVNATSAKTKSATLNVISRPPSGKSYVENKTLKHDRTQSKFYQ